MLQDASLTYQQFKNCRNNLSSWLEHVPSNQVRPSDGPSQISYKLQEQKVRGWGCWQPGGRSGPCPELGPQVRLTTSALTGRTACARWPPSGQCSKRPQSQARCLESPSPRALLGPQEWPAHPRPVRRGQGTSCSRGSNSYCTPTVPHVCQAPTMYFQWTEAGGALKSGVGTGVSQAMTLVSALVEKPECPGGPLQDPVGSGPGVWKEPTSELRPEEQIGWLTRGGEGSQVGQGKGGAHGSK